MGKYNVNMLTHDHHVIMRWVCWYSGTNRSFLGKNMISRPTHPSDNDRIIAIMSGHEKKHTLLAPVLR